MIGAFTSSVATNNVLEEFIFGIFAEIVGTIAIAIVLLPILFIFFFFLSRLDGDSLELFEEKSRRDSFIGCLKWVVPAVAIAMVIGFYIMGPFGIFMGAVYAGFNAMGTKIAIDERTLGKRARRVMIGLCIAQIPIGILVTLAAGL